MTKTIKIEGMMCPHCEAAVKKALEAIDGVKEASASHEKCEAEVKLDKDVDLSVLEKAVTDAGYIKKNKRLTAVTFCVAAVFL